MSKQPEANADIETLVQTIDNNPDILHSDFTPSVGELIKRGWEGAKAVLALLDAPDEMTRERAYRVLGGVVMYCHGWRPGQGYLGDPHTAQDKIRTLLESNGNYQTDAPPQQRQKAIEKWGRWLETQTDNYSCYQE